MLKSNFRLKQNFFYVDGVELHPPVTLLVLCAFQLAFSFFRSKMVFTESGEQIEKGGKLKTRQKP
jgi:hypothetical protein